MATDIAPINRADVDIKLAEGYITLICSQPFFASILLHLRKVEDLTCPTMWTDGKRLGYNPSFVLKLNKHELVAVLCHEVCHVAGLHMYRRGPRDPYSWNVACDKVVNAIVEEAKFTLPPNCIPAVADKSAEELYFEIPPDNRGGGGGNDPGGTGEVRDPKNPDGSALTDEERGQAEQETKVVVQQAVNAAKRAGKLPAGLERMVEQSMEPRIPWKEILSRFVDRFAKNDYSWTRPNSRYADSGWIMPSLHSEAYGKIIMFCDTSGSISQETLVEVASEILGCMDMYVEQGQDPELTIGWFDHAVYPQVVTDVADIKPQGGGGTSFSVCFDWMRDFPDQQVRAAIVVTDGCCDDFGEPPECPVLWVLTEANSHFKPPFGELACTLNE